MFNALLTQMLPNAMYWSDMSGMVDGISPLARHEAMIALNGTPLHPNDPETFDSAKTCMSGSVQHKIACWGDPKRTVWATFIKGRVGNEAY